MIQYFVSNGAKRFAVKYRRIGFSVRRFVLILFRDQADKVQESPGTVTLEVELAVPSLEAQKSDLRLEAFGPLNRLEQH